MSASAVDSRLQPVLEKFRAGDFQAAETLIGSLLAAAPDDAELLHMGAAIALHAQRPQRAAELAREALRTAADNVVFRFTFAQALSALKRHEDALEQLRRILRIDPQCHMAHVEIWNIMKSLGRRHELIDFLKARLTALDAQGDREPPAIRTPIPDTTLCCIDCSSHAVALRAMRACLAGCEFPRAVFFTDRELDTGPIETVVIEPIRSLFAYSEFVMKRLLHHIETDYVLIVQWDGYVVDAAAWSAEFQMFDYVGASLPFLPPGKSVGNGGFSLRSRNLLEVLQDPGFDVTHPEDLAICYKYRECLERDHGIRFAPESLAKRFAFELDEPSGPTFGFHGPRNITRFVDDAAIRLLQAV